MTVLLGSTGVGSDGNDFEIAGVSIGSKYVASASGTVDTITVRTHSANLATTVRAAIFTDNAGTPGTQVGNEVVISPTASTLGWFTSATGINASVTSGTTYWIVFLSPSGGGTFEFRLFDSTTTAGTKQSQNTGETTIPDTWPGSGGADVFAELMDAYAETAAVPPQTVRPDADTATTGWTTTPLFSKINDSSDATFITGTLA